MTPVTLDELKVIAEELRPYTADTMKIEVAPWIRDYVTDMDNLYTELTLEKMQNETTWQNGKMLKHYSDIFEKSKLVGNQFQSSSSVNETPAKIRRTDNISTLSSDLSPGKSDKILMKGDPGMGKTT